MTTPRDLLYTAEHEWISVDGAVATIGVTSYAASKLGDVVFVDLPPVGTVISAGRVVGEIESTKSVGELYAPVDGTVAEINDAVVASPELVTTDPFGAGWLVRITITAIPALLSFEEYCAITGEK
jgi:glycine cleavage system H protein